jgi:hypothetical protein
MFRRSSKILAIALAGALTLLAQDRKKNDPDAATRSVSGTVSDPDEKPVEGAVVQLKDAKTLQVRSYITKNDGSYHFNGLSVQTDYQLKAEFQGASSSTKTLSVFDGRKAAVVNLKLEKKT